MTPPAPTSHPPGPAQPVSQGTPLAGITGLRRRLLVLLLAPLFALALVSAWFDYQAAGNAAQQLDQELLRLAPMLADSVSLVTDADDREPGLVVLLAPPVEAFLAERPGRSGYRFTRMGGEVLAGDDWIDTVQPRSREPELYSDVIGGVTHRVLVQRVSIGGAEVVAQLADGSDVRQQWLRALLLKVLLPNLLLVGIAAFAVNWAVRRALRPLLALRREVESRSPRDLSSIAVEGSPEEVRPLVDSLNRLFELVNAHADGQRRFIADAAHQLRTPLAGLQAQVEAWAQAASHSGQAGLKLSQTQITKLRDAARRTSQLANQLLALSRADSQAMAVQPMQRVDLKELCEAVLSMHLDAASRRRIDLGLDARPAWINGHEWLLREMLSNITDNAVRYTRDHGTVTIRCGVHGEEAFVEVDDDGPGIAPAERDRVVQRFYRVQGTGGEGNGLGLAIADEIARVHHASLRFDTGPGGVGLRVQVRFSGVRESIATRGSTEPTAP